MIQRNNSLIHKVGVGLFLLITCQISLANNPVRTASHIHTVQLYKKGWNFSNPIIQLLGTEKLTLSFDDFAFDSKNYQYQIIHCTSDWQQSDLMETEYLEGFSPNPIDDYQYSFNTKQPYVHYTLDFPNEDIRLKISGNYLIKVFEPGQEEAPILVRPFWVTESIVSILPRIKYTANASLRPSMQQVNFSIQHPNLRIDNAREEIKVVIRQNSRWDNQIDNLKPLFIRNNELAYEHSRESLFEGGNEYRWLDLRSTRFAPEHVEKISFHDPFYHFTLFPDNPLSAKSYFYHEDFNGKYVIDIREERDPQIEADYVYVHFTLPLEAPMLYADVYVTGDLTCNQLNERNRMAYNFDTKSYELNLILKQGFYNYQYHVIEKGHTKAEAARFEGSFGQTENDYTIFVYYKTISDHYERLIGVNSANSLKYNTPGK